MSGIRNNAAVLSLLGSLMLLAPASSIAQSSTFVAPTTWSRGDALTTFQTWDNFVTTQSATPDAADNNPHGPATLTENTGAFVTSTGNIYSFQTASDFDVVVPVVDVSTPEPHALTVIVQIQTLGAALDPASVVIEGAISGDLAAVDSALLDTEVLGDPDEIGGGFGEFRWFLFHVPYDEFADGGAGVTSFNLSFTAAESSMSLEQLLIDTALSPASHGFFAEPNPLPSSLVGDYNGDGFVSQSDLDLVLLNWGDSALPVGFEEAALEGDGGFDGLISQNELDGVLLNWGDGTPPGVGVVPEPSAGLILAAAGCALLRRD